MLNLQVASADVILFVHMTGTKDQVVLRVYLPTQNGNALPLAFSGLLPSLTPGWMLKAIHTILGLGTCRTIIALHAFWHRYDAMVCIGCYLLECHNVKLLTVWYHSTSGS